MRSGMENAWHITKGKTKTNLPNYLPAGISGPSGADFYPIWSMVSNEFPIQSIQLMQITCIIKG